MRSFFVSIFIFCYAFAQSQYLNKVIGYGNNLIGPVSVVAEDSSYVLMGLGRDYSLTGGWKGTILIWTNSEGEKTDSSFYGEIGNTHYGGLPGTFKKISDGYIAALTEQDTS